MGRNETDFVPACTMMPKMIYLSAPEEAPEGRSATPDMHEILWGNWQ
jgi:hypothetical protein